MWVLSESLLALCGFAETAAPMLCANALRADVDIWTSPMGAEKRILIRTLSLPPGSAFSGKSYPP
eukprot:16090362-Heterocapsa_arctica.AAC.1